jgi:hypothetical protein
MPSFQPPPSHSPLRRLGREDALLLPLPLAEIGRSRGHPGALVLDLAPLLSAQLRDTAGAEYAAAARLLLEAVLVLAQITVEGPDVAFVLPGAIVVLRRLLLGVLERGPGRT